MKSRILVILLLISLLLGLVSCVAAPPAAPAAEPAQPAAKEMATTIGYAAPALYGGQLLHPDEPGRQRAGEGLGCCDHQR